MPLSNAEFAERSIVDILIPQVTGLDIEEALSSSESARDNDDTVLISTIPQRTLLFFDERLEVFVVLRTPYYDEVSLKSQVSRLTIALEAHAISSSPTPVSNDNAQGSSGSQTRDVIWSGKVDVSQDPIMVVEEAEEEGDTQNLLLIWKVSSFLSRPRIRLPAPAIIFKLSASLQASPMVESLKNAYLPSGVPIPHNLLQPLSEDPTLKGGAPSLSGSRFSRGLPSGRPARQSRSDALPIRTVARRGFRAIPAISSRVRYHRAGSNMHKSTVVASLEFEIPAFAQHDLEVRRIGLDLAHGEIHDLSQGRFPRLPMKCQPRDNVVCLYSLVAKNHSADTSPSTSRVLDIQIDAVVQISESCRPQIEIRWKTNVDFSTALNPNYGKPGQSIQRSNRPPSIPTSLAKGSGYQHSQLASGSPNTSTEVVREAPDMEMGITVSFTATGDVFVGEPFSWEVLLVNRSNMPRRLALSMVPKRRRIGPKGHTSRPTSSSSLLGPKPGPFADAAMDDNLLYARMKAQGPESTSLVCLSTDTRIGPLQPGCCHSTELHFLALAKGYLQMDAIRFVDLVSNETSDARDLPDIFAKERGSEDTSARAAHE